MQRVVNPIPLWIDGRGAMVDAGYIYVGVAGSDPRSFPIQCYTDQELTDPIAQPLRTIGGVIVDGEIPVNIFVSETNYSIRVEDANEVLVYYFASTAILVGPEYQPLDATLTLLSGIATTSYGRALLNLANQAALQTAVGTPASLLAKVGGTMTGDIGRQGAGVYTYWTDSGFTSGRMFKTVAGAADPTSLPGDLWFEEQ